MGRAKKPRGPQGGPEKSLKPSPVAESSTDQPAYSLIGPAPAPPRPRPILLALAVGLFALWFFFLAYVACGGL